MSLSWCIRQCRSINMSVNEQISKLNWFRILPCTVSAELFFQNRSSIAYLVLLRPAKVCDYSILNLSCAKLQQNFGWVANPFSHHSYIKTRQKIELESGQMNKDSDSPGLKILQVCPFFSIKLCSVWDFIAESLAGLTSGTRGSCKAGDVQVFSTNHP